MRDSVVSVFQDVRELFESGYRDRQTDILAQLPRLTNCDVAIHEFFRLCLSASGKMRLASAQSFVIYACDLFYVRINLWLPQPQIPSNVVRKFDDYFSVDLCHNHPFDFFTIGIFGPGYYSEFFRTSEDVSKLERGDTLSAHESWNLTLERGLALFVERDMVFHTQFSPRSFSMSLNVIPIETNRCKNPQFVIDRSTMRISNIL